MFIEYKKGKKSKLVITFILAISLLMLPMMSFADEPSYDGPDQVGKYVKVSDNKGTWQPQHKGVGEEGASLREEMPSEIGGDTLFVDYSKIIKQTGEDTFDITLDVKTNENVTETYVSSNILIVMDITGSMDTNTVPGTGGKTRWQVFKEAMDNFITSFLNENGGNNNNKVAISVFCGITNVNNNGFTQANNQVHKKICGWTGDLSEALGSYNVSTSKQMRMNCFNEPAGTQSANLVYQYTNGQAAFRAAYETLSATGQYSGDTVPDQFTSVIVVTDGLFNRNYDNNNTTENSNANNNAAISESAKIKPVRGAENTALYTLGIGTGQPAITTSGNRNVDRYFAAEDNTIGAMLGNISKEIQERLECWVVTDPMSKYVKLGSVYDNANIDNDYSVADDTLTWNLRDSDFTKEGGIYHYTLKYSVTIDKDAVDMDNLWSDPDLDKYFPTNKETTLLYAFTISGENPVTYETKFLIPTVKTPRPLGTFKLKKVDSENGEAISGAAFKLQKWNGEGYDDYPVNEEGESTALITDENGKASVGDLAWGKYKVVETNTPDKYLEDTLRFVGDKDTFIIKYKNDNLIAKLKATNDRAGTVTLFKYGENVDEPLIGAEFYLEDEEGNTFDFVDQGDGSYVAEGLPWNDYKVIEEKAAPGYDKDSFRIYDRGAIPDEDAPIENETITVGIESVDVVIDGYNDKLPGDLTLEKMDVLDNGIKLQGAEFELYKLNEELEEPDFEPYTLPNGDPATFVTGEDGIGTIEGLEWGTYRIVETKAPAGYRDGSLTFDIGSDGIFTIGVEDGVESISIEVNAYNGRVLGDIEPPVIQDGGDDGNVLGEEGTPTPDPFQQQVLGEEAKTGDTMNMILILFFLIAAAMIIVGTRAQRKTNEHIL